MKLFILTLFSVTLIAASEPENNVPDAVTKESGNYGIYETNYKGSGYSGGRSGNKQGTRYPEIVEYGYGSEIPRQRLNKNPIIEEILVGYGPNQLNYKNQGQIRQPNIEKGYGIGGYSREGNPLEYVEGYTDIYGYGGNVYKARFPDYKYRRYGREGLGFDKRTAYALGLRYPLTPQLLKTVYRRNNYEGKQNLPGNIMQF